MLKSFSKLLDNIIYPTNKQQSKELWNIAGILKGRFNEHYKYDVRPMVENLSGQKEKSRYK